MYFKNRIKNWVNLLFFILMMFSSNFLMAQNGKVLLEARVDQTNIRIGDLIKYSIIVTSDENLEVRMPNLGANLGAFEIRDYEDAEPVKQDGLIIQRREYRISTYDIGDYEIPPVSVQFTPPGDSVWKELKTESLKITVESMKPSEEGDIRDIKAPLEIELDWWRIIRFGLAGLLIILAGIFIYVFFKRRKEGKSIIPRREKPKRPPHEIALEELEKLFREQLLEKGEIKRYYIRISEIIRHYIGDRFFIVALEMTTYQLTEAMKDTDIEEEIISLVDKFLLRCDLVKFAKYIPDETENQETTDLAFQIIEDTKIVFEPESEDEERLEKIPEETGAEDEQTELADEKIESDLSADKEVQEK